MCVCKQVFSILPLLYSRLRRKTCSLLYVIYKKQLLQCFIKLVLRFSKKVHFCVDIYQLVSIYSCIRSFAWSHLATTASDATIPESITACLMLSSKLQAKIGLMVAGCYGMPQFRMRCFLFGACSTDVSTLLCTVPSPPISEFPYVISCCLQCLLISYCDKCRCFRHTQCPHTALLFVEVYQTCGRLALQPLHILVLLALWTYKDQRQKFTNYDVKVSMFK